MTILAPKPVGRRARKPGIDRKPRQAYSAKQLDRLESEFKVCVHNGILDTEKIFEKIELGVSMASNLVNASQIKWKKWKKDFEIGGIWTPDFH